VIGLSAEVAVFQHLAENTLGTYHVVMNEGHFKEVLLGMVAPPALVDQDEKRADLMQMGFPERITNIMPTFCSWYALESTMTCASHPRKISIGGYRCPQCHAKACQLPTECSVCELMLVSSPHLARSYHHLFPIARYTSVQ
jgi:transcription initiation factor TFIIH subunit 2